MSHSPWHPLTFNVQEFLAYSFSSGRSVSSFVSSGIGEVQKGPENITSNVIFSSKRSTDCWHPLCICFLMLNFSCVHRLSEYSPLDPKQSNEVKCFVGPEKIQTLKSRK